ncbi:hypothetical protein [Nitrosomonas sp. Nm166]|uniref:hypothetical protein n=1 Tax=Nitrosomonas sp. Nm166 TaxID=1881054 RepID=UPI001160978E|nr:hypothetical protein [Nitrosomonas sp. Nm166]
MIVFWPDEALRPAAKGEDVILLSATQLTQPLSNSRSNGGEDCAGQLSGDSMAWMMAELQEWLRQPDIDVSLDNHMLDRFFSRFAYSVDQFVPVDLEIAKHCHPAPGWRQAYNAFHILAGWILIPLVVAAATGFLNKRSVN